MKKIKKLLTIFNNNYKDTFDFRNLFYEIESVFYAA